MPAEAVWLAEFAPDLIDDQGRIVQRAAFCRGRPGRPSTTTGRSRRTRAFSRQHNFTRPARPGIPERALAKAVGEAVERHSRHLRAGGAAANGRRAEFLSPTRRTSPPFAHETPVRCAGRRRALRPGAVGSRRGRLRAVPLRARRAVDRAADLDRLARHTSFDRVAAVALAEVVERDAPRSSGRRWSAAADRGRRSRRSCAAPRTLRPGRLRGDAARRHPRQPIPTVLAVSRHRSSECPAVVVAASASLDPARASGRARGARPHRPLQPGDRARASAARAGRARRRPGRPPQLLVRPGERRRDRLPARLDVEVSYDELESARSGDDAGDVLELCADRRDGSPSTALRAHDFDVAELAWSRAVVPGYHPLVAGHHDRALGGRRL